LHRTAWLIGLSLVFGWKRLVVVEKLDMVREEGFFKHVEVDVRLELKCSEKLFLRKLQSRRASWSLFSLFLLDNR